MEEEATKIMADYASGRYGAVEEAFKRMDKDMFRYAVRRARELGNSAFTNGKYNEAIKYYNEALAGEEASEKHTLLSNRSACHFLLGDNEKALDDARTSIQLKRDWPKGWFRAGRVLFATGKYSGAVSAFTMAKRHETDTVKLKELDLWIDKAEKLAHKAKLVARVTTEYSRFEGIEDPDDQLVRAISDESENGGCPIEFSDQLSEKQRRQLEMLLTGKSENRAASERPSRSLSFPPSLIFSESPNFLEVLRASEDTKRAPGKAKLEARPGGPLDEETKKRRLAVEAPVALCRYLQLTTELREPRKLADVLNTDQLSTFTEGLSARIDGLLSRPGSCSKCWLFMGTGTSEAARQMLQRNGVAGLVNVVRQRVERLECATEASDPLDCVTKDMSQRADLLVIDTSMLEEGLLGRRVVPQIRFARKNLCIPNAAVYPSSAAVVVQAFSLALPSTSAGYRWSAVEEAARWNPYAEPMAIRVAEPHCRDDSTGRLVPCANGDVAVPLSDPQPVFHFCFDGPLETIDEDLPLSKTKNISMDCTGGGVLNAFVVWYQLKARRSETEAVSDDDGGQYIVLDGTPASVDAPASQLARNENLPGAVSANGTSWRHAVFWLDPVSVEKGQVLNVEASHTSSRLRFKLIVPCESPSRPRQVAVARYHLDLLRDPCLLEHLETGLARVAKAQLERIRMRMKRYEQLAGSSKAEDLPPMPRLSILCTGAAPAPLPFLAGHAAAKEIVKVEGCSASTWKQHQNKLQRYHITVVDPWAGNLRTCKKVAYENCQLLLEQCLAPSLRIVQETKWKPVSELNGENERPESCPSLAQTQCARSRCSSPERHCCASGASRSQLTESPVSGDARHDALLKARVKERFSFLEKDVRQLKPPRGEEDAVALLALGELYRLPPGSDIKAQLDQVDEADPQAAEECRLASPACMCVLGLFDYGCLGEGVLPLSKFIAKVLMDKRHGVFVPRRARVFAVLVELGKASIRGVNVETWRTYRYTPDYGGVDLDEETFIPLCAPFEAWDFDLRENVLADQASPMFAKTTKELEVKVSEAGELNAVVFWFELEIDEHLTISTAPHSVARDCELLTDELDASERLESGTRSMASGLQNTPPHTFYRTKAWRQACQMLSPAKVLAGQVLTVGTAHDSTKILFRVSADHEQNENSRPLSDPAWVSLAERHQEMSSTWMKVLSNGGSDDEGSCVAQIAKAALQIAVDAGKQEEFLIDPTEASSFALTLFT
ncbi:tetratricopeptide repeat-containing protein [Besnoitia besnoiti]|uniref:Tetratricopeptide repeat-containing protein n=1 Tax=Besnoitia besnoiti TaxID=94643 RepID=A0A2A9MEZ9_BESBE|nr:tetratricopeptide repeat-containing protein [Besnoitia besnoiti]PFH37088.1 tetratricopeptide repeat-containing protein [Besnoitia besnoiti]